MSSYFSIKKTKKHQGKSLSMSTAHRHRSEQQSLQLQAASAMTSSHQVKRTQGGNTVLGSVLLSRAKKTSHNLIIQTLKSTADNNICTAVELLMYLSDWHNFQDRKGGGGGGGGGGGEEDQVLPPVDNYVKLDIKDDGSEDLEVLRRLRLFSLATPPKELLRFVYYMRSAPRAAQVINRTLFPTTREEEGGGGTTHLWVRLEKGSPADITLLLRSLTVPPAPPLRRIGILLPGGPKIGDDDVEEWKQLCKNKGVKYLCVVSAPHEVMVSADSEAEEEEEEEEEEEQQQQGAEKRKGRKER
ncbi:uncharacterized protein LOC135204521 [Macrobrachium nipponense]|uniref:uncharacterized protein LOC135204521 n=1 Tax=Macrobrachium nipponense TaxID=159736 RepID=UPI0030C80620